MALRCGFDGDLCGGYLGRSANGAVNSSNSPGDFGFHPLVDRSLVWFVFLSARFRFQINHLHALGFIHPDFAPTDHLHAFADGLTLLGGQHSPKSIIGCV